MSQSWPYREESVGDGKLLTAALVRPQFLMLLSCCSFVCLYPTSPVYEMMRPRNPYYSLGRAGRGARLVSTHAVAFSTMLRTGKLILLVCSNFWICPSVIRHMLIYASTRDEPHEIVFANYPQTRRFKCSPEREVTRWNREATVGVCSSDPTKN